MPIDYKEYPSNWKDIVNKIRERSGNMCELCQSENGKPQVITGSKVVLTVHHINFNRKDNRLYNLIHLCQRCHLKLDLPNKIDKRKKNNEAL